MSNECLNKCLNGFEMSKVESLFTDFFNSADAVQVEECTWYYHESSVENELKSLHEQLAKANEDYKALFCAFESCQDELKKANESVEHLKQCISVYHSGIVDMFPHPSVTDGTFFVPIEKYNSMVTKLSELNSKQEQVLANNHSSCELECGAYGTYCKCQDKQLRKGQDK